MSRAGREPAEDVKRRIVAACQQAGLTILLARMYLRHDQHDRVICIQAARSDRPHGQCSISIMTIVTMTGDWSGRLDVRCAASVGDPDVWDIPIMRGRESVPIDELAGALTKTVEEQEQVVAAMKMGVDGPYNFTDSCWEKPPDVMNP